MQGGPASANSPPLPPGRLFADDYDMLEPLGKGAFSVVHKCVELATGNLYAVKVIDIRPFRLRPNFDERRMLREVKILRQIDHPNVIKLHEVYQENDVFMLVMEYCEGTELFDAIIRRGRFAEDDAKDVLAQIADALASLHSHFIAHRDVKPENIQLLPAVDGEPAVVKLLDFGLSKVIDSEVGSEARTMVGTPCYIAPEIETLKERRKTDGTATYGIEVDCWSLGCVLLVMLVARFPEFDRTSGVPIVKLDGKGFEHMSSGAKSMIRGLMNPDPTKRMTMNQALSHPWTVGEPGDGADFIMSSDSATAQPPANPANHVPDAGVNVSGANASGANATADVGAGSTPVVVTDNALPPRGEGPMTKRMSPVSTMEFSSQGSPTTGTGLASLAEHSADGSSTGSEPTSPHSLAASSDTEGAEGSARGTPPVSVQGEGSYDMAGRDSTDRSSTASTISISVSDMQRVSTSSATSSMHGSIVEAQTSNKQLAVTELESSGADDDCTKTYGPRECVISYTCPILAFQQRIFDLFRVSLRLPEGSTETRAKLLEGANMAKVAAVENIAQIRKLHNLTKDIHSGIDDLVLAAEVEEPGLAHEVLNQHRRQVEDLQDQRRVVQEMNMKLAQIVHSIVAASATDHLAVDTATETVTGSPTSRDVQLDADLAILVKEVEALKAPLSRRATLSPEGILMPPAAMPAIEKAESDDGAEGQGVGGGLDADGGQIATGAVVEVVAMAVS